MTNGEKLDQIFPDGICPFSKKWLDYEYKEPTTKNNLAVEKIVDILGSYTDLDIPYKSEIAENILTKLPSVTPQEPQTFKWCDTCKEYDQENHCCHRWSKVIRNTVEEMKQEYIEREVLDKIRAEVENINVWGMRYNSDTDKDRKPQIVQKVKEHVIEIIDKYKADRSVEDGNDSK